jgi:fructose-bisphosphate aldolase class II
MPIVTLSEILKDAQEKKYGVAMFDVHDLAMTNAVIEAAEEEHSPVILALAEIHAIPVKALEDISNIIVYAARRASVPVCAHFDHGMNIENCIRVMHRGFSSVMYDGSVLPYEENVRKTAELARFAAIFGASVEGELGHVGNAEGGGEDESEAVFTDPVQTEDFVEKTKIDALAVSIGTVHGFYKCTPKLDLDRLSAIRERCPVPLVLHGGSGLSDKDFCNCIQRGIAKINIYTEFVQVATDTLRNNAAGLSYHELMRLSAQNMKEYVRQRLRLFGSSGKAG